MDNALTAVLDKLCPMHVVLTSKGHIAHAGPTLAKILPGQTLIGQRFFELFELRRPRMDGTMAMLRSSKSKRLHLMLRQPPRTEIKGVLVPLPSDGTMGPADGAIINLSFGISVVDAVRDFNLTSADFALTDLTVEMLFLVEAKSAAMEASRKLTQRLQKAKFSAEELAHTDTLTGLYNRRSLDPMVERMVDYGETFAFLHLDLDFFKQINDTLGHLAGDQVLRHVATALGQETRGADKIFRIGGDEFVILLSPMPKPEELDDIAQRLISRLERPMQIEGKACRISASIGSALSVDYDPPEMVAMLRDADTALYEAKSRGRGCHVQFQSMKTPADLSPTPVDGVDA